MTMKKNLCQGFFFNKVACLKPAFYQKVTLAEVFSCGFCKIFKNTFLQNTSGGCICDAMSNGDWTLDAVFH